MQLASRFASRSPSLRSDSPLSDDQIRRVAPSIFADAPHGFALDTGGLPVSVWPQLAEAWLRQTGFL